jgi:hypothetical protein
MSQTDNLAPGAPTYDVLRELGFSHDELRQLIASLGNLRHLPGPERTAAARELLRQLLPPAPAPAPAPPEEVAPEAVESPPPAAPRIGENWPAWRVEHAQRMAAKAR